MAIVEDELRNDSEEENEIEVVVEEDDADQDSDDSDDDDDELLEGKVAELERRIAEDPYNYDDHIELIQALWGLSELDRWRAAFDRLQQMTMLKPEHWMLRIETEESLAHTAEAKEQLVELFQQASLDCYYLPILSAWCTWALGAEGAAAARARLDEPLRRAAADPLSGKLFWDARRELETAQLEAMTAEDPEYKEQRERVLWTLEETVSRPLLNGEEAWPHFERAALDLRGQDYVDKVQKQHDAAIEYLQKITPYEDKLLVTENPEEKIKVYEEYIEKVKVLSEEEKYADCDSNGILKVLYDRATSECVSCEAASALLAQFARHAQRHASRATLARVLALCTRRRPRRAAFWLLSMQQAEHEARGLDQVKTIFENALSKGMESYKQAEALWMGYLEGLRRSTAFDNEPDVERLRRTFRLAWDSLAEAWGEEANDCEVPLYWARLEYTRMKDPKQGREIFDEIFKYGENKSMSKYWEALVALEARREPAPPEHKLRELLRRALRCVRDYPPAAARLWADFERDRGSLHTARECAQLCEEKLKEWRDNYQAMKDKMTNPKKGKQAQNKKGKFEAKKKKEGNADAQKPKKGKRKSEENSQESGVKKKKDSSMEADEKVKDGEGGGLKRSHEGEDSSEGTEKKRQRTASAGSGGPATDACTVFVSNLDHKVDEKNLRAKLSEFGEVVSMRLRTGVKSFGGSICYCQYSNPEAVEEAIKHDRTPLDGRPMFLSRYSAAKGRPAFKYATTLEKNKLFVRNLPYSHSTKEHVTEIFEKYGKITDVRIVTFKDGKPKGLAYVDFEEESCAAAAVAAVNGRELGGRALDVAVSAPPPRRAPPAHPAHPAPPANMRRTQLSSFIPSVLQKPSTSKASESSQNGEKRPLSNTDFRALLLKK